MRHLAPATLFLALAACNSSTPSTPAMTAKVAYDTYGAGTSADGAVAVETVLRDPSAYAGKPVKLSGPIAGTCAVKGCWMRLGTAKENVFVKFKDYGFFVPTGGVEGRQAVVEGNLAVTTQSVEEIKHYLADAGKHEEAAKVTEPRQVISFMATGVAIQKPQ